MQDKMRAEDEARVIRTLKAGQPLDLARDWMTVVELADRGVIETRIAPSGQLEIVGLAAGQEIA